MCVCEIVGRQEVMLDCGRNGRLHDLHDRSVIAPTPSGRVASVRNVKGFFCQAKGQSKPLEALLDVWFGVPHKRSLTRIQWA